nr:cuticle protein 16.5-like [Nomia melanderi]
MRVFVVSSILEAIVQVSASFLLMAVVASSGATPLKKLSKRGLAYNGNGVGSSSYLPPVPDTFYSKPVIPAPTYGVPSAGPIPLFKPPVSTFSVPAPTYGVPAVSHHVSSFKAPLPSLSTSFVAPGPTYGAPSVGSHVSSLSSTFVAPAPAPVPAPTYGVPVSQPAPIYSAPVSHSVGPISLPSSSYGVPSTGVDVSLGHVGSNSYVAPSTSYVAPSTSYVAPSTSYVAPSSSYGAPSVIPESGLNLGLSLHQPATSYGVPSVVSHNTGVAADLSVAPAVLPAPSHPVADFHGQNDGYSYPVPSKQLLD